MTKASNSGYDFIVIGAGSAGCAVAARLAELGAGSVLVVEAGPSDRSPLVKMPFGLVWMMGSKKRDWRFMSSPQSGLGGRQIKIPRGKMLGGSGSINSMVWFRGRRADFDNWNVAGWSWNDLQPSFVAVEAQLKPRRLANSHPAVEKLNRIFPTNDPEAIPSPERQSAGVFEYNLHNGKRWSAADAYLRPAIGQGVTVISGKQAIRIGLKNDRAHSVELSDGSSLTCGKGIILSSGSIGSPEILLRSGIGPKEDLKLAGIDCVIDAPQIGKNLHDHPGAGIHYAGPDSGYGLSASLAVNWMAAPFAWALSGKGIFASPTVEGGAFFNAANDGGDPDIQSHFIPFKLGWTGSRYTFGRGYFADAVVCRPRSRGSLRLGKKGLEIDLGIFNDERDLDLLTLGWMRLRKIMEEVDLDGMKAPEAFPADKVQSEEQARDYIRERAGTAYHPVGSLRMGTDKNAPVDAKLKLRGTENLWVADASIMPAITSANTNAPSMMIGHRAAELISGVAA